MGQTETTPKGEAKKGTDRMEQPTAEKGSPNATESNRHAQEMKRGEKADKEKFGESKTDKGRMDEDRAAQGERGQGERSKPGAPTTAEQGRQAARRVTPAP